MKKPNEFRDWCKAHGIAPRSHDESVAWAAWCECYRVLVARFTEVKEKEAAHAK